MGRRLTVSYAADLLREPGARLVLMHLNKRSGEPLRAAYFIVPGREIPDDIAEALIERPDIVGAADALFPGCNQTWQFAR